VRLLGLAPPSALPALIAQHHLLVLPCRRAPDGDQDGVPLVLMEALATGRPALSTPVSGIPELLGPEVGWLAPPDDPSALAGLLAALTVEDCAARGAAGPAWLRRQGFTLDAQVSGLLSAWEAQGR
jgi:glycosyltransferase involved in cell wall biosynthesis